MQPNNFPVNSNICAIICVRNERDYLEGLIKNLHYQGIDIVFIDNDSTDGSREIIDGHVGSSVLRVLNLAYKGSFSLSDQLQAKANVEQTLEHDWIMHVDADEIHHASSDDISLVDVARRADKEGCNAINFEEFVFLPQLGQGTSHLETLRYYYYAPLFHRLVRLYRRGQGLDNRARAGHGVNGNPIIYPQNQVLRHYIALDQSHLIKKYLGRVFDEADLQKGWHRNRVGLTEEMLSLRRFEDDMFDYLPARDSRAFLRNRPRNRHFWSW